MLSAKIRFGHSFGFKPGDVVELILSGPKAIKSFKGQVHLKEGKFRALLVKKASRQDKVNLFRKQGFTKIPAPDFFRQHFWLAIVEEEITLVLEGFLNLLHRNIGENENDKRDKFAGKTRISKRSQLHPPGL